MAERIHMVVDATEKEQFRRAATRAGQTLSEWLRDAAREKVAEGEASRDLDTVNDLERFFEECDAREPGTEPDWPQHLKVIQRSATEGSNAS